MSSLQALQTSRFLKDQLEERDVDMKAALDKLSELGQGSLGRGARCSDKLRYLFPELCHATLVCNYELPHPVNTS